jgi:hypothetical protein
MHGQMPLFSESPYRKRDRLLAAVIHFISGAFLGLFPALVAFCCVTFNENIHVLKVTGILLLIFCLAPGLLFVLLGLIGRGKVIYGIYRLLGHKVHTTYF